MLDQANCIKCSILRNTNTGSYNRDKSYLPSTILIAAVLVPVWEDVGRKEILEALSPVGRYMGTPGGGYIFRMPSLNSLSN